MIKSYMEIDTKKSMDVLVFRNLIIFVFLIKNFTATLSKVKIYTQKKKKKNFFLRRKKKSR